MKLQGLQWSYVVLGDASLYEALVVWVALFESERASSDGRIDLTKLKRKGRAALFFVKI
jgi:hypothetical protein